MTEPKGRWYVTTEAHSPADVYRQTRHGREIIATCEMGKTAELIADALNFYEGHQDRRTFAIPIEVELR